MIRLNRNDTEADAHYVIISSQLENRISSVLSKGRVGRTPIINLTTEVTAYLSSLLQGDNLRSLITASPDNFQAIIADITATYPNFVVPNSEENLILRNIFISHCYDSSTFDKWDFIKRFNIDTCPYCNRNYIYYLSRTGKIKPPIDHFFPKSIYPFLAVCYYNLIPSCQTCNGFEAKGERDPLADDLISPYLVENENFKFTYKIRHINFLNSLIDKTSIHVKFRSHLAGHLNVFKLDKLYEQHSDHVLELIVKSKVAYSQQYRNYLNTYNGLKFSDSEIDRMILGNYSKEEEFHKRPLAKMYKDIGKELGLIP